MKQYMNEAIRTARTGMQNGHGGPFGACIVKGKRVLASAHNTVLKQLDPTCHAEINAIRIAARKVKHFDLSGCTIYSTNEPCPMCFAAIHWAGVEKVIYGTSIQDAAKRGFRELIVSAEHMKRAGKSKVRIRKKYMHKECIDLLNAWDQLPNKRIY